MTHLPTGVVTFFFTDIEGSTRLWERYPDAMKMALARHDDIVRRVIQAHGGHVFKAVGDSFYSAFAHAPAALNAALATQRALQAQDWSEIGGLRVRAALHTGAAEERQGDYLGPTINRILSLMAVGHGGQILLSQTTYELTREALPLGAQLRDLGERRLKDLRHPEHIYQLVAPDLPADFPPLRTLDMRPTNLPSQPTALIGRELEAAAVCAFLRRPDVRWLTLTGPGGTGKTRLALQVAADLLEEFADGVFFVPLGSISAPALVASAIAQALGVRESVGQSLQNNLQAYLRDKQLLLVLDNFEQVVQAGGLVADLIADAPGLKALVTSRIVLHAPGENTLPVPPLALPKLGHLPPVSALPQYSAVALFVERARAVKPDFALTEANAAAVVQICARLDCLPLAIELAAARSKLLSPQAMLNRLERRLPLLTGGARDRPARQQTMRGAIAWSYDLLTPAEQTLFQRLAIFAGGFTPETAHVVVGEPASSDLAQTLEALVDKSMVRCETISPSPRFRMLDTIREYALERLEESGELPLVRQRHVQFFLELACASAVELLKPDRAIWLERLEAEHDNLRAAWEYSAQAGDSETCLRLAGALRWFWYLRGHWSEGRGWLERALTLPGANAPTHARAMALYGAGELARLQGERAAARRLLEEALHLWREQADKGGLAYTLTSLGQVAISERDRAAARRLLTESINLFREIGDRRGLAYALRGLGTACSPEEAEESQRLFEESIWLFREIEDTWGLATPLGNVGFLAYRRGDWATARRLYEESLAILRQVGDKWLIADALNVLGEIARCEGDYQRAASLYQEAMALFRELGSRRGLASSYHNLGHVALHWGDYEQARTYFIESLKICQALRQPEGCVYDVVGLAGWMSLKEQANPSPAGQDRLQQAARLLGAAHVHFEALNIVLDPADRFEYENYIALVRARLDDQAFAQTWADGQTMSLEQAIACALRQG